MSACTWMMSPCYFLHGLTITLRLFMTAWRPDVVDTLLLSSVWIWIMYTCNFWQQSYSYICQILCMRVFLKWQWGFNQQIVQNQVFVKQKIPLIWVFLWIPHSSFKLFSFPLLFMNTSYLLECNIKNVWGTDQGCTIDISCWEFVCEK